MPHLGINVTVDPRNNAVTIVGDRDHADADALRRAALSTYVPLHSTLEAEVFDNPDAQTRELPIFMAHGSFDPVVPMALGELSNALVTTAGYRVEWHEYPMAHSVCIEEIGDIQGWLLDCLGKPPP